MRCAAGETLRRCAISPGILATGTSPRRSMRSRILIRRDHVIRAMLEGLGATVREVIERFQPVHGAYHAHGHRATAMQARVTRHDALITVMTITDMRTITAIATMRSGHVASATNTGGCPATRTTATTMAEAASRRRCCG